MLCLIICISGNSFSQSFSKINSVMKEKKWYKPDYFKIQYAGNIGFMSLGLGYDWWREIAQSDLLYGYVPVNHGNATIHTFTIKNTFRLYEFKILNKYNLSPTFGFSVSLEPGENSYMRIPNRYPEGYYTSNSFYACLNAGIKSHLVFKYERRFSAMDLYFEINTLADYAYYNIVAQEDRSNKIFSIALGVNMFF
jgi:hypothetical protein